MRIVKSLSFLLCILFAAFLLLSDTEKRCLSGIFAVLPDQFISGSSLAHESDITDTPVFVQNASEKSPVPLVPKRTPLQQSRDAYFSDAVPCTADQLRDFALNRAETVSFVRAALASGDTEQQFQALRLMQDFPLREIQPALESLALNEENDAALCMAACYGLKHFTLGTETVRALFQTALATENVLLSRSALIALAGSPVSEDASSLSTLLTHPDPLTRIYALRLSLSDTNDFPFSSFDTLTKTESPSVRCEFYEAVGSAGTKEALVYLKAKAEEETEEEAQSVISSEIQFLETKMSAKDEALIRLLADKAASPSIADQHWAYDKLMGAFFDAPILYRFISWFPPLWQQWIAALQARTASSDTSVLEDALTQKHNEPVHYAFSDYLLNTYAALNPPMAPNATERAAFLRANVEEDKGSTPLTHAYNPLTGRGFLWKHGFGGSSLEYGKSIAKEMQNQSGPLLWASAGRVFHLLQDMTSPCHVHSIWHPFNISLYEAYWTDFQEEVTDLLIATPAESLLPDQCALTEDWHLDTFTKARVLARISALPVSVEGFIKSLAWHAYYASSYWGALQFSDNAAPAEIPPLQFSDGSSEQSDNALRTAFNGSVELCTSWHGCYFKIKDRKGKAFYWNKCFLLDTFRPCANNGCKSMDGHKWLCKKNAPEGVATIAGRFVFLQRGFFAEHCYPPKYADGAPMEKHLSKYHGDILIPACMRYGLGFLDLFTSEHRAAAQSSLFSPALEQSQKNSLLPYTAPDSAELLPFTEEQRPSASGKPPANMSAFDRKANPDKLEAFQNALESALGFLGRGCIPLAPGD